MSSLRRVLLRLLNVFRPGHAERQLAREVDAHLALLQESFERRGMAPDDARLAARRAFGGIEQAKEYQRDARSFRWLDDAWRDLGYAGRTLRRNPGFTAVAIVTLALGVGSVTVIYSVLRNVFLDPFPYTDSDRMVDIVLRDSAGRRLRGPQFAPAEFLDYQENTPAFEDVVGTAMESMHWMHEGGADRLLIAWMTPNGFTFLGVGPLLGRVFGPADAAPGAPPVAVLNHRTWITLFGGDPAVVGRTISLNDQPRTIVGIMPPRFEWNVADLWLPNALSRSDDARLPRSMAAFQARLRPGVSLKEAEAQLNVIATRRAVALPNDYPPHSHIQVITVIDWVVGRYRGVLYTLFAAVSLLLVIACCNVANMLLARATAREREITIRAALGASRGRIVRQLLTESALLALGGAIAGCLLAYAGIGAVARFLPRQNVPWETEIRLDTPVLLFALATAAMATFAFGLFPALQSARRELVSGANSTGRSGTAGRQQTRMRSGLVIAEVSLSIILLLGAGLLMRSFMKLIAAPLGFDPQNLLIVNVTFPPAPPNTTIDRRPLYRSAVDRLHAIPGVRAVTITSGVIGGMDSPLEIPGRSGEPGIALVTLSSEEFVETLGVRVTAGRSMSLREVQAGHKVAVVSDKLVAQYLSGQDPIGRTIRLARLAKLQPAPIADPTFTIVGVVSDVMNQGPQQPPAPQVYVPYTIRTGASYTMMVRASGDPMAIVRPLKSEMQALDRQAAVQPTAATTILENGIYAQPRFVLTMLGMFAVTGLVLVALGVYGVLAYTVSQRSQEIAIRMALGGARGDVLRLVFRLGLKLVGVGLVVGLAASVATNRVITSQLSNISPHDPVTLAGGVMLVVAAGICACWVPARRAIRVEPIAALRHE